MSMLFAWGLALALAPPPETYRLVGVVHDPEGRPVEGALVVVQCTCIEDVRERVTNEHGTYVFRHLPAGTYTVQVLYQKTNITRIARLGPPE